MNQFKLHQTIAEACKEHLIDTGNEDQYFFVRLVANAIALQELFHHIYGTHPDYEIKLIELF